MCIHSVRSICLIKVGETTIRFFDIAKNDFDSSAAIEIVSKNNIVTGRFIFSEGNHIKNKLLELDRSRQVEWKSDCESLIISKSFENKMEVIKIDLCIDSHSSDEYWSINVVSASGQPVEIDQKCIETVFS